ncbi:hypothetical protein MPSEU_001087500 [Mayamaea pseudoterrestris]|nr:hypothetical protein MPSEU_001087500 [Mayamaea pseudoterrestris]
MPAANSSSPKGGEPHRIYWQQWLAGDANEQQQQLMTSSVLVKLFDQARAQDVCDLLLETLKLDSSEFEGSLLLVGTLFSLPKNYVQYEHEMQSSRQQQHQNRMATAAVDTSHGESSQEVVVASRSEPFHVVHTLRPSEHPLQVLGRMQNHLTGLQQEQIMTHKSNETSFNMISPKMRWYFVSVPLLDETSASASNHTLPRMPSCIQLDGYCTSMEEEDSDDEQDGDDLEDESEESIKIQQVCPSTVELRDAMMTRYSWLQPANEMQLTRSGSSETTTDSYHHHFAAHQLAGSKQDECFAGYLDKQSRKDGNVWRRTYCAITEDYFCFATRIYHKIGHARHERVRLTRALLLEPTQQQGSSSELPSNLRSPNTFEIVTAKGTTHVFRAPSRYLQTKWVHALRQSIVQSFENGMLDDAERNLATKCAARTRRGAQLAAESLWDLLSGLEQESHGNGRRPAGINEKAIGAAIRWGMDVAEYREACFMLRSDAAEVTTSEGATSKQSTFVPRMKSSNDMIEQIENCWNLAAALLARANHIILQLHPTVPRGLDTICRHVAFVINGRMRQQSSSVGDALDDDIDSKQQAVADLPPDDLLNNLLDELQRQIVRIQTTISSTE